MIDELHPPVAISPGRDTSLDMGYGAIAVALAAVVVYAISLANGFAFDDVVLIPNDARVTGAKIWALMTTPYWNDSELGLYRPLTSISFALDWAVSNGSPAWFHFTNMLWHVLASVLAFALIGRFFRPAAALLGGLLFAIHPVHVEAVANIVGRAEMIASTFFLAACLVWTARSIRPMPRLLLTVLCYALAMFAKESAVVLPAILILLDIAQGAQVRTYARERWRELAALTATLIAFMVIRWSVIGGLAPVKLDPSLEVTTTAWQRILTALPAWPIWARLLTVPSTLLADYGPRVLLPVAEWTPAAVIGLTLVIASVAGGIVAIIAGHRRWALGLLWFPITILTVSNFIFPIGVIVAERTLYLPAFAICFAAAAAWQSVPHTRLAFALVGAIILGFTVRSVTRIPDWDSTDSIMQAMIRDRPDGFRAQWHMARLARKKGDVAVALAQYDKAMKLWPYREGLALEATVYVSSKGNTAWARNLALFGTQRWPDNPAFFNMLAAASIDMGDSTTARRVVADGLRLHPDNKILNDMWRAFGQPREAR